MSESRNFELSAPPLAENKPPAPDIPDLEAEDLVYISFHGMARDRYDNFVDNTLIHWIEANARRYRYNVTQMGGYASITGVSVDKATATMLLIRFDIEKMRAGRYSGL